MNALSIKTVPQRARIWASINRPLCHGFNFAKAVSVGTSYFLAGVMLIASSAAFCVVPPGSALQFNGTNSVTAPADFSSFTEYTIEAWVKPTATAVSDIIAITNGGSEFTPQLGINSSGKFEHYLYDGNARFVTGTSSVISNQWYHLAITAKNSGQMHLYVNGIEEGSPLTIGTFTSREVGLNQFYLAGSVGVYGGNFTGVIDEVRSWNIVLTQTEIQTNMHKPLVGNETGLVAYYNFDQSSGTTLPDITGHGHDGTLVNGLAWIPATWVYLLTGSASAITDVTASVSGNVINDNTATITASGICYGTSTSPTTPCTTDGTGSVTFNSSLTGLTPNTLYYARAYATNPAGTFYDSNEVTFTTLMGQQTVAFTLPSVATVGEAPLTLSATATSGLPVTFASTTPGVCIVSGTRLTVVSAGTCTVTANQAGNASYNAASQVAQMTINLPPSPLTPMTLKLSLAGPGTGHITSDVGGIDCSTTASSCTYTVNTPTWVTLTPQPNDGSQLSRWMGDPACTATGQVLITQDTSCTAAFTLKSYQLTANFLGKGRVTGPGIDCPGQCTATYLYGTTLTLKAQATRKMWEFSGWRGCDSQGQIQITNDALCQAVFTPDPNIPNAGDGNGDGLLDANQDNVVSLPDKVTGTYLTFEVQPATCVISDIYPDLPDTQKVKVDQNKKFPQGLLYFDIACPQAQVSVYYHGMSKVYRNLKFYKFGPKIPGDLTTLAWYQLPNVKYELVTIGGKPVVKGTYTLKDGELGDSTGVDGHIVDPGGIVYP